MADEQRPFKRLDFSRVIPGSLLQTIVIDAVFPYMVYPLLADRLSAPMALSLVALFPLANIAVSLVQKRTIDLLGVGALFIIASLLAGSRLSGDTAPALRYALPVAFLSTATLLSLLCSKPAFFFIDHYFMLHSSPEQMVKYKTFWWDVREYRHMIRVINTVWGVAQLLVALLSFALFFVVARDLYLMMLPFVIFLPYALLVVWTLQYRSSFERRWTMISQELHVEPEEEEFLV
ncbi:MAG: hypothetical protein NVS2B12_17480 [Ktedonobacteraceae bacterium]